MWAWRKLARLAAESYEELTSRKSRRSQVHFRPSLEGLEERWCPATSAKMYWDPTVVGNNGSNTANWDLTSLGSGTHPSAAPGNTLNENDTIYFDGTAGQNGNKNCTWDYTPTRVLFQAYFQNGYTQTLTFSDKQGFSVSYAAVTGNSAPTITPNGSSGANAVAAITLTNGAVFSINSGNNTLFLQGYSSGNAIFLAGDGTAGEYISNGGTVAYAGVASSSSANIDYLKIPVDNEYTNGVFKVNGNGSSSTFGSVLQISGADATNTGSVSFYNHGNGETDIYGNATLWCVNDFKMNNDNAKLQTTDSQTETLKVGTSGSSPVDGTVTILGGTVNINPGTNVYGKLAIVGTTDSNVPTLNVGSATLNIKVNTAAGGT